MKRGQARREEALRLDARQKTGQQGKIALRRVDGVQGLMKGPPPDRREPGFDDHPLDQPLRSERPVKDGRRESDGDQRERSQSHTERRAEIHRWRSGPCRQKARASHRRLGRQDGDVLAEIEHRPQLADRRLPGTRFRQRGGRAEPVRERRFADLGTGCVEQLEERRGPEQIEIAGVRMAIEERPAVPAGPGPAATQPIEAAQVHPLGAARPFVHLEVPGVHNREHAERHPCDCRPRGRNRHARERHPEQDRARDREEQPSVRDVQVDPIVAGDPLAPPGQPAIVFRTGIGHIGLLCRASLSGSPMRRPCRASLSGSSSRVQRGRPPTL